ncbi:site-specific integrase [Rossellomorea vietnamensis]|uniref:site-specific integrase n=1 Tax=Rossellomorea vietnamensis TaxID=218284 RepID=UPI00054D533D|nr:site-specific integrase [Rossellomorea vietnamensis]
MKGYIRKRGNKWSFTVDIGRDPSTGKRKQKTKGGFLTKKEAQAALSAFQHEMNTGTWIESSSILMKDFSYEWFESIKHNLRATTAEQYHTKLKNNIVPFLGELKVQEVKVTHAHSFAVKLLDQYNPSTAHKIYAIIKMIMDYAVDLEIVQKNPFKNVKVIKNKKSKFNTWSFEELQKFLRFVKKHDEWYYSVFYVAAYTGMRKGEVLGLKKSAIDFDKQILHVISSVSETKEEGVQVGDLKTPSSRRVVSLDEFTMNIIKQIINKNNILKMKLGPAYEDDDLIFCHPDGKVFRPSSLNRPMKAFIERSGVPKIRFHDLRHTHATLLLELGVNPKVVADRLGHASVKETLDTYSHVSLSMQGNVAELFSKKANEN